jgi:hypothetical protein
MRTCKQVHTMASKRRALSDYDDNPRRPLLVPPEVITAPPTPQQVPRTPARQGKKAIAFWVDPAAAKQLRSLALREDRTLQDCMVEALDDLFAKYGMHRIASTG